jgi:hypothetical protein
MTTPRRGKALTGLPEVDRRRLGVTADWKHGPHLLTYRQTEYTFGLVADALAGDEPGGLPSGRLQGTCDGLLEASVPDKFKDSRTSLAVDWTDLESFSRPPPHGTSDCADPGASWGHRKNNLLRSDDELFYGYYLSAAIMMGEEAGPPVPEIALVDAGEVGGPVIGLGQAHPGQKGADCQLPGPRPGRQQHLDLRRDAGAVDDVLQGRQRDQAAGPPRAAGPRPPRRPAPARRRGRRAAASS